MKKEKYIYIGDYQVAFLGTVSKLNLHSHVTWTLCLRINGDLKINFKDKLYSIEQGAIIPPKFKHSIYAEESQVLFIFFEKHNKYFLDLCSVDNLKLVNYNFLNEFQKSLINPAILSKIQLKNIFENLIKKFRLKEKQKTQMDERIQKVIRMIDSWSEERELTLKELSFQVLVSESRLSHLFSQEMGIPISSFKIWKKIKKLAISLQLDMNLTDASQEAGFYDSSHFHRTFSKYFGINPKKVFMDAVVHWIT